VIQVTLTNPCLTTNSSVTTDRVELIAEGQQMSKSKSFIW